jgi:hypothetical protein
MSFISHVLLVFALFYLPISLSALGGLPGDASLTVGPLTLYVGHGSTLEYEVSLTYDDGTTLPGKAWLLLWVSFSNLGNVFSKSGSACLLFTFKGLF